MQVLGGEEKKIMGYCRVSTVDFTLNFCIFATFGTWQPVARLAGVLALSDVRQTCGARRALSEYAFVGLR